MRIPIALALIFCLLIPVQAHAKIIDNPALYANEFQPVIKAEAVVLAEVTHGKILFQKNMNKKMYPASLVKVLTALVALEYLELDELVIAGNEINKIPYDASRSHHKSGETLTVENLIRALFVSSGNDTSCILAMEVARRTSGNLSISYSDAEKAFCALMNEKAKSLGANNSNFVNPHGYHNSRQFTTAYDMLLICAEALENPTIARFAAEASFEGNGASGASASLTQDYSWKSTNALITNGEYYYSYATGIRTGQTNESGSCLAASAEKDGKRLICIMLYTEDPDRWLDTVNLFNYGFDNFDFEIIQEDGILLGEVKAANTALGENDSIEIHSHKSYGEYISKNQFQNIQRFISFDPALIYEPGPDEESSGELMLIPPINKGDVIGKVSYILNDTVIFTGDVISGTNVTLRTFNTDAEYYFNYYKALFFSMAALPYWIIAGLVSLIAGYIIFLIKRKLKEKKKGYKFIR